MSSSSSYHVVHLPGADFEMGMSHNDSDCSDEVDEVSQHSKFNFNRFRKVAFCTVAAGAVLALGAYAATPGGSVFAHKEGSSVGTAAELKPMMKDSIGASAYGASNAPVMPVSVPATPASSQAAVDQPTPLSAVASPTPNLQLGLHALNSRRVPNVNPLGNLHDGNSCGDTEELLSGLCYTKCSILMGKPKAYRDTAFSCCPTSDCHLNPMKMKTASLIPCSGFDISSSAGKKAWPKACPHLPGACLVDEEQFLGQCYETCDKLTNGVYKNRVGPMSCCDTKSISCLNPFNIKTSPSLYAGDGIELSHFPKSD